ncbi:hypothetical protein VTG60DRAFT_7326 [Thermothelomyces hinnuleus]
MRRMVMPKQGTRIPAPLAPRPAGISSCHILCGPGSELWSSSIRSSFLWRTNQETASGRLPPARRLPASRPIRPASSAKLWPSRSRVWEARTRTMSSGSTGKTVSLTGEGLEGYSSQRGKLARRNGSDVSWVNLAILVGGWRETLMTAMLGT